MSVSRVARFGLWPVSGYPDRQKNLFLSTDVFSCVSMGLAVTGIMYG